MDADNPLIGTWKLVSWVNTEPDGKMVYPYGRNPVGYLIYTGDGYMSAEIMDSDRRQQNPRFPVEPAFQQTLPERDRVAAYDTYLSCCGTYSYSLEDGRVTHHVKAGLVPSWSGSDQPRQFKFEGGRLVIGRKRALLTWERAANDV